MSKILRTRFLLQFAVACGLLLGLSGQCLGGPAPLPTREECAELIKNSVARGDTSGNTVSPAILRACAEATTPKLPASSNAVTTSSVITTSPTATELVATGSWDEISAAIGGPPGGDRQLFVFGHGLGLSTNIGALLSPTAVTNQAGLPPSGSLPFVTANANDQVSAQLDDDDFVLAWNGSATGGVRFPIGSPAPAWTLQHYATWTSSSAVNSRDPVPPSVPMWVQTQFATQHLNNTIWFLDPTPGLPVRSGFRPALALWRYTSSNGIFGFSPLAVDSATTAGIDPNYKVAPSYCPWLEPSVGGFDRPEISSDPWSARHNSSGYPTLWLSVRCGTIAPADQPKLWRDGTYQPQVGVIDDMYQLYTSSDGGLNWAPSIRVGAAEPMMMVPTPSGTLFLGTQGDFTYINPTPAEHGQANAAQYFSPVWPGTSVPADPMLAGLTPGALGPNGQHICPDLGIDINVFPAPMGAAGPEEALIAFPASELTLHGKVARQVLVVSLVGPDTQGKPEIFFHKVIRPLSPAGSIVLFDMISEKRAVSYPANFIYWLETDRPPASVTLSAPVGPPTSVRPLVRESIQYTVRGMVIRGSDNFQGTMVDLSGPARHNTPAGYSVPFATFFGDYMHGTSFYDATTKTLTFVPVWPAPASNGSGNLDPYARLVSILDSDAVPDMSRFKPQEVPRVEQRFRVIPFEHQEGEEPK